MHMDHSSVWDNCLSTIRQHVNAQSFKTWFEPIRPVNLDSTALTIQVPNRFFYEWLEEHYVGLLKMTIKKELGTNGQLLYQIVNGAAQKTAPKMAYAATTATTPSMNTATSTATNNSGFAPGMVDTGHIKNPFISFYNLLS